MSRPTRRASALIVVCMLAVGWFRPATSQAQSGQQCFNVPGITNCIQGRFLEYWRDNGGLPVFGYPITAEFREKTPEGEYTVQYFERNVLEYHPEKARPYDVLLGRLGDTRLLQLKRDWFGEPKGQQTPGCSWWAQTGHSICGDFKAYWESHGLNDPKLDRTGRSLQLFGLPLTEPRMETNSSGDTVLTQWFERARFEYHAARGEVLLGLLSNEIQNNLEPTGDLIDFAVVDIENYWRFVFAARGWNYFSPYGVVEYESQTETPCGPVQPDDGPHYCRAASVIYLDLNVLQHEYSTIGDMAIVTIIAHEWGHHVQQLLSISSSVYYNVELELQADCFAGAYAGSAELQGLLEEGDIDEALLSLSNAGDPIDTPWDDPAAHGTPTERQNAFLEGLYGGFDRCIG